MKRLFILAAVAALALTSCQQEKDIRESLNNGKNSVSFVMESGAPTRASEVTAPVTQGFSAEIGQVDGVSIFIDETITDLGFSTPETRGTPLYTENLGYTFRDKLGVHTSTYTGGDVVYKQDGNNMVDGQYWCYGYEYPTNIWGDGDTDVDFAFYMPADMTSHGVTPTFTGKTNTFTYLSPDTAKETQDIVFGGVTKTFKEYHSDYAKYGGTKVKLFHALTGIKFAIANPKENGKLEYDIQITKISFIGLANGGTCTFTPGATGLDDGTINWTSKTTEENNEISQTFAAGDLVDFSKTGDTNHFASSYFDGGTSQNINDAQASKTFWMVPQSITNSDAILRIEFKMSGKEQFMEIRLGDLKSSTWEPAQIRTYTFKLDEVKVKIEDTITMADPTTETISTPWGDRTITSYNGSTKQDVVITNTGNCDAFIRAAIVGQWRDTNGNPVFGYTDFTHGIQLVASWYEDQFVNKTYIQGKFTGLPGTDWVLNETDGYYYYTKVVPKDQAVPSPLFTEYKVGKAPGAAIAGNVQEIYFTLEIATQAISAKKLDGTNYTYTEAWARANSFTE